MKKIYIPSNLNRQDITNIPICQNEIEKYYYFIHLIYEQRVLYKIKEDYVPLKALYLRRIINEHFERYRAILIDKGIIDCDYHWIKGKKSYGYKLLPPYAEADHVEIELTNPYILKNIEKWKARKLPTTDVHLHLYKFLKEIEIKYDEALDFIKNNNENNQEYNCDKMAIDKFLNKDYHLYNDDYGRVHTNITNLKSTLRKYLSYKGLKLFNIDIINSQPLFLLLIPSIPHTIRCAPSEVYEMSDMDIFNYKSWVENGVLYDYLMREYGIENRQEFKESFFRDTFFGKYVSKKFWEVFPSIAKILTEVKKKDYKTLAHMMQRAESSLMISTICGRIMREYPDVFIATIHDSILTTEEHVNKIKSIISTEFKNKGLLPAIRIETA